MADLALLPIGSIQSVASTSAEFAITFDDGPDPDVTPGILDLLKRCGASATFFLLSDRARAFPELVRRIGDEGHEIGLHFDRHERLTLLTSAEARARLTAARAELERLAGPVGLFRPPFGAQNLRSYLVARSLGLEVVVWGPYAREWAEPTVESAADHALAHLRPGDILLLHDGLEVPEGEPASLVDRLDLARMVLAEAGRRGLKPTSIGALRTRGWTRRTAWFRP